MSEPLRDPAGADSKALQHEAAAQELRHWVRLTSTCNNRCVFCLDAAAHDGVFLPEDQAVRDIEEGRRRGATRLILSGGEASIHPSFVKLVKLGHDVGYSHVQTITNGRMFSYPQFLRRCVAAGLDEITFSIHGPNPRIHDALVGVRGAFEQAIKGLRGALATGRVVVNVDICLNRANIKHLPRMLDLFMTLGVREFDLLHIIPFGRAYDQNRDALMYDVESARGYLRHALELSKRPDVHIWLNRLPPPFLEGYEQLIQDPHKLLDEVRGRREEYERLLTLGEPLHCREPDRCALCYMRQLCDALDDHLVRLAAHDFDAYHVEAAGPVRPPPFPVERVWVRAVGPDAAATVAAGLPGDELVLELDGFDGVDALLEQGRFGGKRLVRACVSRPEDLATVAAAAPGVEIAAYLSREMAAHLQRLEAPPPGLVVALRNHELASVSSASDANLPAFFAAYAPAVPVENIPPCVSGRQPRPPAAVLHAATLRETPLEPSAAPAGPQAGEAEPGEPQSGEQQAGEPRSKGPEAGEAQSADPQAGDAQPGEAAIPAPAAGGRVAPGAPPETALVDMHAWTERYILDHYYTKSRRCCTCEHDATCPGMHINFVRAHGYRVMQPEGA